MRNLDMYRGIIPAFYCCYDDNGDISAERTSKLAEFYLDKGVKGLYVEGSSGECIYHNVEERKTSLEAVVKAVGGKLTVIAHIAAPSTRDSIELAKHAKSIGADAIAAIPGVYYSLTDTMVERYWNDISSAVDIDMIIYNIPQTTGFSMSADLFRKMLQNQHIVGVKNSSMEVMDIQIFKEVGGDDVIILNGSDEQYIAGRVMGAEGGIGGTYGIMPKLFVALDRLIAEGRVREATALQFRVNEIIYKLCSFPCMISAAKSVLKLRGVETGGVRPPFINTQESEWSEIEKLYESIMRLEKEFAEVGK